jgi:hypothetical protein
MVALLLGLAGLVTVWVWALCIAAARADRAARRALALCESCEGAGVVHLWREPQSCPECWGTGRTAARAEPAHGDTAAAPRKPRVALVERAALQERDTVGGVP